MPRKASVPSLTANQARYILEKLIDDGQVSAEDVRRHLAGMWQEMSFIEKRLAELRSVVKPVKADTTARRAERRRRRVLSPQVAASMRLQGQYLGLIRQIPEGDRKRFQEIAKTKGREAAIGALRKRLGRE